ncbi:hypothetical protein SCUCBS95973_002265 [Sporothrix curviconia]|uniref:Gluconokinase n=1 Tax=Sporothrix curviconia TaxID=1260050 RepID=A0ABP0B5L0_9PEZI
MTTETPSTATAAAPAPPLLTARDGGCIDDTRWIVFVIGSSASGKTVTAKYLADILHAKYIEGDDFHPKANVEKMSHGEPLTDADRAGWLQAISEHAVVHLRGPGTHHLIVTCSALKRDYRALLRTGAHKAGDLRLLFLLLDVPEAELIRRSEERARTTGHFAKSNLVHSQLAILERPDGTPEHAEPDVVVVDGNRPLPAVEASALAVVEAAWHRADEEEKRAAEQTRTRQTTHRISIAARVNHEEHS